MLRLTAEAKKVEAHPTRKRFHIASLGFKKTLDVHAFGTKVLKL